MQEFEEGCCALQVTLYVYDLCHRGCSKAKNGAKASFLCPLKNQIGLEGRGSHNLLHAS